MSYVCLYITSNTHHLAAECGVGDRGGSVCWVCEPPYSTRRRVRERSCTLKALILKLRTQSASLMTPRSKHLSPPSSITRTSPSKQCAIVYSMGERKKNQSAKPPSDLSCSEREKIKAVGSEDIINISMMR